MPRVYATVADLSAYGLPPGVSEPVGQEATRVLARASERVDDALLTAVYATDDDGMPTDPTVIAALRDATCAQVLHWAQHPGAEDGTAGRWTSVAIGRVSLSGGTATSAAGPGGTDGLCPAGMAHLRRAGLLSGAVGTAGLDRRW